MEDKSFNDLLENERNNLDKADKDVLRDFTDGSAFKQNKYFKSNPGAYAAHFYSDAVEVSNPLGAAKGKHKINQVFYTVCQIPKDQRSKIDRMQLCMVFKDKHVKKYGYEKIFSTLIDDLKQLEEGITVSSPIERKVKLAVLAYSADNLEAHSLGGFSMCFSSRDICRFCHATHPDLKSRIHDFDSDEPHRYWKVNEYNDIFDKLEEDEEEQSVGSMDLERNLFNEGEESGDKNSVEDDDFNEGDDNSVEDDDLNELDSSEIVNKNTYGLRKRCPLNKLASFHSVLQFPPDCVHDLMEGVIAQDLFGVIKILVNEGWFTIDDYNKRIKRFSFLSYEAGDKP